MRKIYLASSWKNENQPRLVELMRSWGHDVYDFRNPPGRTGFDWRAVNPNYDGGGATFEEYSKLLQSEIAVEGFFANFNAMAIADTCVLLLPSGRSAHLEAGWFMGRGHRTIIYTRDGEPPELMALMADHIVATDENLFAMLRY